MIFKLQNNIPKIIISFIIVSAFLLMLGPAKQDSAIMDELAHIPAGYSYVKFLDFRLNPEHPPLVKALSAFPLLFQSNINFPTNNDAWESQVNAQWELGTKFLYESGNDADKIIFNSRLMPMILLLLLIGFTYFWAAELMGKWWALLPAGLIAFSTNFLSHGHYVTTDIGATLGILVATYYFLKYASLPSNKNIIIAGLAFGFAQLLKFSAVLLAPFFILITLLLLLEKIIKEIKSPVVGNKVKKIFNFISIDLGRLILIFIIGGILIYLIYGLFTLNYPIEKQYSDTGIILQGFGNRLLADPVIAMSKNEFLRPIGQYLLGVLMVMQRSSGGNTSYLLGEVSNLGSWYYFPIVFLMKESLPTLIIIFIAFIAAIINILKNILKGRTNTINKVYEYFTTNFSELCLIIFVLGYWLYSIRSPLNIGFRHIMPTLPFIYILASQSIKKIFFYVPKNFSENLAQKLINSINKLINLGIKSIILAGLLIWLVAGAVFANPYFLSNFNEFFGGTYGGYKYVTDSNFDWGQDLKRLKNLVEKENIDKIALDYFGGGSPMYYLGNKIEIWNSSMGNPIENDIKWFAVSINNLQNSIAKISHRATFTRNPQDEYIWLKDPLSPTLKAGTSIFIYNLER